MRNLIYKILCVIVAAAFIPLFPEPAVSRYRVSGVVEFSYRDRTTKTGDAVTSENQYWTQYYRINLQGPVFDPRFLQFRGGVGYSVYTYKSAADSDILDYDLSTFFFPGRKVSWDLFGRSQIQHVEGGTTIAGYDVTTTSYGGTLRLHPTGRGFGNNSNYNNNNGSRVRFPSLTLSHVHTDAESLSPTNPLDEVRDLTKATLDFRINSRFVLTLDGQRERYKNLDSLANYDHDNMNLTSRLLLGTNAELKIDGLVNSRGTQNMPGFNTVDRTQRYIATLDFKEKNRLKHYYQYTFNARETPTRSLGEHFAEALVIYRLRDELKMTGSLKYRLSEDIIDLGTPAEQKSTLQEGGLSVGPSYSKSYRPDFMGPFAINTAYNFGFGFSELTSETGGQEGRGRFYTNDVTLGLSSYGWKDDEMSLFWNYNNKRDHSPVENNLWRHSYIFNINTKRVPKTTINGSVRYTVEDIQNASGAAFFILEDETRREGRSYSYNLLVNYAATYFLNLIGSASRGKTTSNTFTLSTLGPPSNVTNDDQLFYGEAFINYPLTRRLLFRSRLREQYRSAETGDLQTRIVNMFLDYRIRKVFIVFEYRWQQDIPDDGDRTTMKFFFARLSRPF